MTLTKAIENAESDWDWGIYYKFLDSTQRVLDVSILVFSYFKWFLTFYSYSAIQAIQILIISFCPRWNWIVPMGTISLQEWVPSVVVCRLSPIFSILNMGLFPNALSYQVVLPLQPPTPTTPNGDFRPLLPLPTTVPPRFHRGPKCFSDFLGLAQRDNNFCKSHLLQIKLRCELEEVSAIIVCICNKNFNVRTRICFWDMGWFYLRTGFAGDN